tara:strand:- start:231 stop:602 length:372 start_codon:yes stop_codon:yes gene_type:complete
MVKKEAPTTIVDSKVYRMAMNVIDLEQKIKALEEKKVDVKELLKESMEIYREESDTKKFVVACELGEATVSFVDSSNSSIRRDLLLEAGVKPSIVEAATVAKEFSYIRVKEAREAQIMHVPQP